MQTVFGGDDPCLEKICYPVRFLNGHLHSLIHNLVDAGYFVYFFGVDDYYVPGKSWYRERHFDHDGMIFGYDQENENIFKTLLTRGKTSAIMCKAFCFTPFSEAISWPKI